MKIVTEIDVASEIEKRINIIDMTGNLIPLKANAVQLAFEARVGKRNIVMKSRQMGFTTWCMARHILFCLMSPNTHSVGVFQNKMAADHALKTVFRMTGIPEKKYMEMSNGSTYKVLGCNQVPPRGLPTIDNLHISELARYSDEEVLEEVRHLCSPDCEEIVESAPFGAAGIFYEEWLSAKDRGVVQHFFPWWMNPNYSHFRVPEKESLTAEECALVARYGLSLEQIGFRRHGRARARIEGSLEGYEESYLEKVPW